MKYLWVLPFLPAAAAALDAGIRPSSATARAGLAAASTLLAFVLAAVGLGQLLRLPAPRIYDAVLATWIPGLPLQLADGRYAPFQVEWGLHLDPAAGLLALAIAGIGTAVHLVSLRRSIVDCGSDVLSWSASLNLFLACLLALVLGSSAVSLLAAWVGLGLSSQLLLGRRRAGAMDVSVRGLIAASVADWLLILAMLLAASVAGTLDLAALATAVRALPPASHSGIILAVCALLAAAVCVKSAQVPLSITRSAALPPTGAAIYLQAAAVVGAGAYVLARNVALFQHALAR